MERSNRVRKTLPFVRVVPRWQQPFPPVDLGKAPNGYPQQGLWAQDGVHVTAVVINPECNACCTRVGGAVYVNKLSLEMWVVQVHH